MKKNINKKNNLSTYSDFLTYRCSCISVITCWRSFIQMLIIQMAAHIVNNHIIMAFYIDCIHTDICEQSVITCWLSAIQMLIIQIQAIPHKTRKHIWKLLKKKKKKKVYLCKKGDAKLRPHQMTGASQRASRAVARERQNSNKQSSVYLWLFFCWMISFCLGHCLLQNHAVFERNL